MRHALLIAIAAAAAVALVFVLVPGSDPAPEEGPAPAPPQAAAPPAAPTPPPAPAKVELEDVDLEVQEPVRDAVAAKDETTPKVAPAVASTRRRQVATVSPAPREPVDEAPSPAPEPPAEPEPAPEPAPAPEPPPAEEAAAPPEPPAPAAPPPVRRVSLDKDSVIRAMSWMKPEIAGCFQKGLERDDDLSGTVYARFVIEVDRQEGRVLEASVDRENSTLADGGVQTCILDQLGRAQFPMPGVDSARVHVRYPFTMRKTSQTPF